MNEGSPTPGSGEPGPAPAQPEVPAGWYPHPTAPGWEAYWTGSGWGTETRPAQAQPEAPPAPVAEPQTATQPAAEPQTAQQPAAAQNQPAASDPATAQQPAAAAATAAPAATATATPAAERSESALPAILCVLGAVVAIVGSFLPEAKLEFNGTEVDLADNTMVAAGYGIAVIAAAVIAAGLAIWAYLKAARTWLPILVGAIIVAIAVYAGTAGLDVTPDFAPPGLSLDDAGDPSTGVFAVGAGGLLIVLGGIGLARNR
jgi:hypothetical protein